MHAPRGLAIQLRDKGSIMGIQFTNVSLETQFIEGDGGGMAEPLYITALPRNMETRVRTFVWHAAAGASMSLSCLSTMPCNKVKWQMSRACRGA